MTGYLKMGKKSESTTQFAECLVSIVYGFVNLKTIFKLTDQIYWTKSSIYFMSWSFGTLVLINAMTTTCHPTKMR